MSRIDYGDPGDDPITPLWPAIATRAIQGKPGQAVLKELMAALLSLPTKRLIAGEWVLNGEVCALGALDIARTMHRTGACWDSARMVVECFIDEYSSFGQDALDTPEDVQARLHITPTLAWEIMEKNDVAAMHLTPEQRYKKVLAWVSMQIKNDEAEQS